ncbi:ScbR family autoregulator-binding transcription factor [Streptomyces spiramyceticus]|uniref:ScbR family autoregulator-binding transcription factor n=1 Tax=Streptomyces spiramyceticus TaxID=299717 RepID=UPI00237BBECE|nr:ScbR family autoregulator-binding transcription factor [Streptomyces spiramyceticus]
MAKPKQERAIKTRETLINAAAAVFEEHGFTTASINDILAKAGVTRGALYFHFPSKEELAQGVMSAQGDSLELPQGEPGLQTLIDTTLYLARELQTNVLLRAGVRLSIEQSSFGVQDTTPYELWVKAFREHLDAAKARGELLPHADPRELSELLVAAYSGVQLFSQLYTNRADLPQRIAVLWRALLPGIAVSGMLPHLKAEGSAAT